MLPGSRHYTWVNTESKDSAIFVLPLLVLLDFLVAVGGANSLGFSNDVLPNKLSIVVALSFSPDAFAVPAALPFEPPEEPALALLFLVPAPPTTGSQHPNNASISTNTSSEGLPRGRRKQGASSVSVSYLLPLLLLVKLPLLVAAT